MTSPFSSRPEDPEHERPPGVPARNGGGRRLTLLTAGTQGDVQPFVALGLGLRDAGYDVTVAAPQDSESLVSRRGLPYAPLRADYYALATSEEGRAMLSGNPLRIAGNLRRVVTPMIRRLLDDSWEAGRESEAIVFHPKVLAGSHLAEALSVPAVVAAPVPMLSPTGAFPMPGLLNRDLGPRVNRASYGLSRLLTSPFHKTLNTWRRERLGLPPRRLGADAFELRGRPLLRLYGYSPHVVPTPADWDQDSVATGYWSLGSEAGWRPPEALARFLDAGDPPVYVGFGSMGAQSDRDMVSLAAEAVRSAGRRGVIATGWGQRSVGPRGDDMLVIEAAPHDWLFPRTAAVVHHGGAGTTGAGLRAARPTVICPFSADQPFWGRVIAARGLGPEPVAAKRLSVKSLGAAIRIATEDVAMRDRVEKIGSHIRAEDGVARAVGVISRRLAKEQPPGALRQLY